MGLEMNSPGPLHAHDQLAGSEGRTSGRAGMGDAVEMQKEAGAVGK